MVTHLAPKTSLPGLPGEDVALYWAGYVRCSREPSLPRRSLFPRAVLRFSVEELATTAQQGESSREGLSC